MKKMIIVLCLMLLTSISFANENKATEIEKYQAQLQALIKQRQQYLQTIEIEMIKTQAIIEYLKENEKKKTKKK